MRATPNLVLIHAHDAGRMIQPYGYNTPTPRLQRFAEHSVTFRRAFAAAPTCSPARAALLTGRYPHCCGMHGLASPRFGFKLVEPTHHLAHFLAENGYMTALAGIQHEAVGPLMDPRSTGYQHWLNHDEHGVPDGNTLGAAVHFLGQTHDTPFFLSCGIGEPHRDNGHAGRRHGYDADLPFVEDLDGRYTRPPAPIPDNPTTRQDWASFQDGIGRFDRKVGTLLDAIDSHGLADNTLVIVTTDHGIAWPHAKGNLTDMGLGVMLMMRGPTGHADVWGLPPGRVLDAMVSQMDIFPTLCDMLGLEPPPWLQGLSMTPLLSGQTDRIRDHVFGEQGYHCLVRDPQRSIRTERYRYVRRADGPHLRIVDDGPANNWMRSLGYANWPAGTELLFDTWFDPSEVHDLSADPTHQAIARELSDRLDRWMADTDDPFVTGDLPEPIICES